MYSKYKKLGYNLALQYTQNVEDAEEITQDVFIKVYENLYSFRGASEVKTWIYRITVNRSLDYIKAKKRKKRSFLARVLRINDEEQPLEIPDFTILG